MNSPRDLFSLVALLIACAFEPTAQAATFTPACTTAALVGALSSADGNGLDNTITLPAGCVYTFTASNSVDINGVANALPRIDTPHTTTINGNNAVIERSPANGIPAFRLLNIDGSALTGSQHITVVVNDLTLRYGSASAPTASGGSNEGGGGAIFSDGYSGDIGADTTLTLNNVSLLNNTATGIGGAIAAYGTLNINAGLISGNSAAQFGGGVGVYLGYLSVQRTAIENNQQSSGSADPTFISGGGGIGCFFCLSLSLQDSIVDGNSSAGTGGGGVAALGSAVTIARCRISSNHALLPSVYSASLVPGNAGGVGIATETGPSAAPSSISDSAIYANTAVNAGGGVGASGPLTVTISNSTISGNHSDLHGGGIGDAASSVSLINVTVAANSAPRSAGLDIGAFTDPNGTTVGAASIVNSVISNNTGSSDCYNDGGTISANSHSLLLSDASAGNACDGAGGLHFALRSDPLLSTLSNHGGPDPSHLPLAGSPLLGAGDPSRMLAGTNTDERGTGFVRTLAGQVDIGAIEAGNTDVIFRNGVEFH